MTIGTQTVPVLGRMTTGALWHWQLQQVGQHMLSLPQDGKGCLNTSIGCFSKSFLKTTQNDRPFDSSHLKEVEHRKRLSA